jgi:hypothetical protein
LESSRRRSKGLAFSHFGRAGQGLRGEDASRSAFAGFRGGELGAPVGTLADRGDERQSVYYWVRAHLGDFISPRIEALGRRR